MRRFGLDKIAGIAALVLGLVLSVHQSHAQATIEQVRKRGHLICGVSEGLVGFSANVPSKGWQGFDVDFCKAVAHAVLATTPRLNMLLLMRRKDFLPLRVETLISCRATQPGQ